MFIQMLSMWLAFHLNKVSALITTDLNMPSIPRTRNPTNILMQKSPAETATSKSLKGESIQSTRWVIEFGRKPLGGQHIIILMTVCQFSPRHNPPVTSAKLFDWAGAFVVFILSATPSQSTGKCERVIVANVSSSNSAKLIYIFYIYI